MKTSYIACLALIATLASGAAMAQTTIIATSPGARATQVAQRLQDQEQRINSAVAAGKITPQQAAHDQAFDSKISQQLSADEAKHGGIITVSEQKRLNHELDKNFHHMHKQHMHMMVGTSPVVAPAPVAQPAP